MMRKEYEKSLKRFLKRKISYSFALLISFLITGEISLGVEINSNKNFITLESIKTERQLILDRIKANEKRIKELEKDVTELIKEGDYYAKTLDESKQFFFPLTYEHHHGKVRYANGGDEPVDPDKPVDPDPEEPTDPENPVYPPGSDIVPPDRPNIEYPEGIVPPKIETPEVDLTPVKPENIAGDISVPDVNLSLPTRIGEVELNIGEEPTINIEEPTDNIIVDVVAGSNVRDIQPITPTTRPYNGLVTYEPRYLKPLEEIENINISGLETKVSKGLENSGKGYDITGNYKSGAGVGTSTSAPTMFQNVFDINTKGNTFTMDLNENTTFDVDGSVEVLSQGGIGNDFLGHWEACITDLNNLKEDVAKNVAKNVKDKANINSGFALILDSYAKDTAISGNFDINNTDDRGIKKLFMLTSGVGIRNVEVQDKENLDGAYKDGLLQDIKTHIKVSEIKDGSNINLYNTNSDPNGFLVGIEHQNFDENFINDRSKLDKEGKFAYQNNGSGNPFSNEWNAYEGYEYYDKDFRDSYTVFLNNGTLNLNGGKDENQKDKNDGKNIFGVVITHEFGAPNEILKSKESLEAEGTTIKEEDKDKEWISVDPKTYNNITANGGEININGSSSIGMSFETYIHDSSGKSNNFVMRDDAYVGKINVGGDYKEEGAERQGNYGFRMTNLMTKSTRLPLLNGIESELAGNDAKGIAHNRFLERYWGKDVTNEDIVYMLAKWNDQVKDGDDFFTHFLGKDGTGNILEGTNGENNKFFSEDMGVKLTQTTEIEVTDRIIKDYDKYYDKVNIYGGGIINIDDAFADNFDDHSQLNSSFNKDKIDLSTTGTVVRNKYGQVERITGLDIESQINVSGDSNVGVVIEKSLSSSAKGYEGADTGSVNGIANVHGFNITVGGKNNVGFLRGALSSTNNTNDFVITDDSNIDLTKAEENLKTAINNFNNSIETLKGDNKEVDFTKDETLKVAYEDALAKMKEEYNIYKDALNKTSAINTINFAKDAENSTLIRSDRFGITLEKDLNIGLAEEKETDDIVRRNTIMQATTSYTEDRDRIVENKIHLKNENGESKVTFGQNRGWENIAKFLREQDKNKTLNNIEITEKGKDIFNITCKMSSDFWKTYNSDGSLADSTSGILKDGKEKFDTNEGFSFDEFVSIIGEKREQLKALEEQKIKTEAMEKAIAQLKNDILYLDLYYKEGKGKGDTQTLFAQVIDGHQNLIEGNKKYINAFGSVTNKAKLESHLNGLVGMIASGTTYIDKTKDDKDNATDIIDENTEFDKENRAKINNYGQITLSGNEGIGMAVVGFNEGYLGKEPKTDDNSEKASISVKYDGTDEGKYSIGVYNEGVFKVDDAKIIADGTHSMGIYNTTAEKKLDDTRSDKTQGEMTLNNLEITLKNGAIGLYSEGGTITTQDNVKITNSNGEKVDKNNSIGVYASTIDKDINDLETTINLNNSEIHIENGTAGVASVGDGSTVNLEKSKVYYSGDGYALYTDKGGTINVKKDSLISLGKDAYGYNYDATENGIKSSVTFEEGSTINVEDNSVTIAGVVDKRDKGNRNSYSSSSIKDSLGLQKVNITADEDALGYKIASIDGGNIIIDGDGKSEDNITSNKEFLEKYRFQRVNLTVAEDQTIDMTINSKDADTYFGGQVVGIELNSSKSAGIPDREDTSITLESGAKVKANRLDSSDDETTNTTGLYINYGEVTLNNGSSIEVENQKDDNDTTFDNGIGIFAVNGSKVETNKGSDITVYGNKGIGIYASTFRTKDDSSTEGENGVNEFGKGGNKIEITNNGTIDVSSGKAGIGIYADNNSKNLSTYFDVTDDGVVGDLADNIDDLSTVKNSGIIKVGGVYSDTDKNESLSSIGIYGINTQIESSGTIEVTGESDNDPDKKYGGIGIYASNGSVVTSVGEVKLGDYSAGVVLDSTSTIKLSSDSPVKFGTIGENDTERIGIFFNGQDSDQSRLGELSNIKTQVIDFDIDGTEVNKLKAVTGQNVDITLASDKKIDINGNSSRGIRIDNGTVTNEGIINLGTETNNKNSTTGSSIGISAVDKKGYINNEKGTININSENGIGIYVDNSQNSDTDENKITNIGTISLNSKGAVGVLLKNSKDNKALDISNEDLENIKFSNNTDSKGKIAIYADGQNLNLLDEITKDLSNDTQDILFYANQGADIKNNSKLTINGMNSTTTDNKAIGVYLAGGSDYEDLTNQNITVSGGAIGIFSNAINNNTTDAISDEDVATLDINAKVNTSDNTPTIGVMIGKVGDSNKTIEQKIGGDIHITSVKDSNNEYGIGLYVNSADVNIGTDKNKSLNVNVGSQDNNIGIYLTNGGSLTGNTDNKVVLSKIEEPNKDDKLAIGVYYSGDKPSTNNVDIEINSDGMVGISSGNGMELTNSKNITFTSNEKTAENIIGAYASKDSTYTQDENSKISLGKGGIGIYSAGKATVAEGSSIEITSTEDNDKLYNAGMYAINDGSIENNGSITVDANKGVGMFISGENSSDKITGIINNGTIEVTGENVTGVYVKDGHSFTAGENSSISVTNTSKENSVSVGILLDNATKLTQTGKIYLQGDKKSDGGVVNDVIGVYSKDTDVDADIDLVNTDSQGIALVARTEDKDNITIGSENTNDKMNITIGDNSIGAYLKDTGVKLDGLAITSDSKEKSTVGIFLADSVKADKEDYDLSNVDVSIKNGTGIILSSDNDDNSQANLRLSQGNIKVTNDDSSDKPIGIYSQGGDINLVGGNSFDIKNGIGIYVENGKVTTGENDIKDSFKLSGNSIGLYSGKAGDVTIGKNTEFNFDENSTSKGNYAYANNGSITNNTALEVKDSYGIIGKYSGNSTANITNNGDITITGDINADSENRTIGIAAIVDKNSTGDVTGKKVINTGNITVNTEGIVENDVQPTRAIGIYSESADIENSGTITLTNNSAGIYYNNMGTGPHNIDSGIINITGDNNKAIVLRGHSNSTIGDIKATDKAKNNTGLVVRDISKEANIELGNITLGQGSKGVFIDKVEEGVVNFTSTAGKGNIVVGDSIVGEDGTIDSIDRAVGIMINESDVSLKGINSVTVGKAGIGVYAKNSIMDFDFANPEAINIGENGIYIYADADENKTSEINIDLAQNNKWTIDNYTGIVLRNNSELNIDNTTEDKKLDMEVTNGGTGIISVNTTPTNLKDKIDMTVSDGTEDKYSIGFIYQDIIKSDDNSPIELFDPTQSGAYTIGNFIKNTVAMIEASDKEKEKAAILVDDKANNSIGLVAEDNSEIKVLGTVVVQGQGNKGMVIENSMAGIGRDKTEETGAIIVGRSDSKDNRNIGVYLQADKKLEKPSDVNNIFNQKDIYSFFVGAYDGKPILDSEFTMSVQNGSAGIIANNYNLGYFGNINVYDDGIGIYSEAKDEFSKNTEIIFGGDLNVKGDSSDKTSIGILGKDTNIKLGYENMTADLTVSGDNNFGVVSDGLGDINFNGELNISGTDSTGIYKLGGDGDKIDLSGKMNVGERGFGVIASAKEKEGGGYENSSVTITNDSDITLGKGAVGIYSVGQNSITNNGNIDIGEVIDNTKDEKDDEYRLSTGIYGVNVDWTKESLIVNNGNINAIKTGSIGAISVGNTIFTNKSLINVDNYGSGAISTLGGTVDNQGTINVKGGGVGLQAFGKSGITDNISVAYNSGTINVGLDDSSENSKYNVGMEARDGGKIVNTENGNINVHKGIGMYIDEESTFENKGTITVHNGIGIAGAGKVENKTGGIIDIKGDGKATAENVSRFDALDTIKISENKVTLGNNYYAMGGKLSTDKALDLDGVTLDVTKFDGDTPAFSASDISGDINVDTNVILDRDETEFRIDGLFDSLENIGNIDANLSFLYDVDIDKNLGINFSKISYSDFATSVEDIERNNIFDSIREGVTGVDADLEALKYLDYTVSNIGNPEDGKDMLDKYLGEMGGNVYSSTQRRMQDVQRAFENSFEEMETSYNFSKDTEKYSLIRTEGDYKHSKNNLINYDYDITGLLFMQEYEGTNYGDKWGYSGGFTVSNFDFKDSGGSEEDVYSLRAGLHNVKYFGNDLELLTKFDVGYNRHDVERKLAMPDYKFENSADINSYQVNLNNTLRKKLYNDLESDLGIFASLDLEYGRIDDFEEKGTLPVEVKSNDYFTTRAEAGLNGTKRIYLGDDWTMKLNGKAGYSYNFGDNYDANEARIRTSDKNFYVLPVEEKEEGVISLKAGLGFERLNYMGVTLEGEWIRDEHKDEDNWNVALRFYYKFGGIEAKEPRPKVLKFEADNFFDFDKSTVKPKGQKIIEEIADIVNSKKINGTLTIEGHTDWTGTEEYNQKLSERRANSIKEEFNKHLDNPDITLETKGYGELRPIATNRTKEGRAENRRVEMHFLENKEKNR